MSKAKFLAAKELIEQHRYKEARAILKTMDEPLAKDWLRKLEARTQPNKKRNFIVNIVIGLLIGLLIVTIATVINVRNRNEQVQVIEATLSALEQQQRIQISAGLTTYCTSVARRSQGNCRRWAEIVTESRFAEAVACDYEYDWIYDTNSYSLCMLTQGVSVMQEDAIVEPLDPESVTAKDQELTGALIAYCDDQNPADYCFVWALDVYANSKNAVHRCDSNSEGSILTFFSCLEGASLTP